MARFYVPDAQVEEGMLRVEGSEARHIRSVLRLKAGDRISVFDGSGKEYEGTLVELRSTSVLMKIVQTLSPQNDSPLEITLAQSLLKGEKMDYLIQKATELGIRQIVPFTSSRSIPLLEKAKREERHRRWEKIAIEASKQCGRGVLPRINPIQDFSEILRSAASDALRLILWEKEGIRLKRILEGAGGTRGIFFVVGPEGGWSEEEVEESRRNAFTPITLGKRILRSETASLCFVSILQYEWGDLG